MLLNLLVSQSSATFGGGDTSKSKMPDIPKMSSRTWTFSDIFKIFCPDSNCQIGHGNFRRFSRIFVWNVRKCPKNKISEMSDISKNVKLDIWTFSDVASPATSTLFFSLAICFKFSAYSFDLFLIPSGRSLMNKTKSKWPKIEPCGTLEISSLVVE